MTGKKRFTGLWRLGIVILVTTTILVTLQRNAIPEKPIHQTRSTAYHKTNQPTTPQCTFITPPSQIWSYNSRSHCHYPTACISNTLHLPSAPVQCVNTTSTGIPYSSPQPCTPHQLRHITCAYSPGVQKNNPSCTTPLPLPQNNTNTLPTSALFVPRYPYPANIYHFANVVTTLSETLALTPPSQRLTIVFLAPPNKNRWQTSFLRVITTSLKHRYENLKIIHAPRNIRCFNNVTILGFRGHVNVWPFANTTVVTPTATKIPSSSIAFRNLFYTSFNLSIPLPPRLLRPPPLVLGYARRTTAVTAPNVHHTGTFRRFSESDEAWFISMLTEESKNANIVFKHFMITPEDQLHKQASTFAQLGAVIGIHGANLVNSIFMPPLSALIELFPTGVSSQCYFAGSNSGLRYFRFESSRPASPEESGCFSGGCLSIPRHRLVKVDTEGERDRLRFLVRQALQYIVSVNDRFRDGVPVKEDPVNGVFRVVE